MGPGLVKSIISSLVQVISAHADEGPRSHVRTHAGPSAQPPINVGGNFPAHVSAELSLNIFPNSSEVISEVSQRLSRIYLKLADFHPK